jgi:hypothetical protein
MNPFLSRALRFGGDALELGRTFAQPMVGEIPAGLHGLSTMMRTGDMDQAAEDVEAVRKEFEYAPKRPGTQRAVEKVGEGVEFAKDLWNAQKGAPAIAEGWDKFVTTAPGIAAAATGLAGVVDPTHGGGKAARTAEEAARIAALRAVRESTPKGPMFRSAVEEAVPQLPARSTVGQYVATLSNRPGIKGEELADLGLRELDPTATMTREEFLDTIKQRRAPREQRRQSYDMIPDELMSEKITDIADLDTRSAVGNPESFEKMGLEKFAPIDEHPDLAVTRENQRRAAAWDEYQKEDPDLFASALQYVVEDLDAHGNDGGQRLWDDFQAGYPEAEEQIHSMANALIANARDNKKLYGELMDLRGADLDARWKELEPQFGSLRGAGDTARSMFQRRLEEAPGFSEFMYDRAEERLRRDPGDFNWEQFPGRPTYPGMRYYGDVPETSGGYSEILETQQPIPWAPDKRQYNEGHWEAPQGQKNNVTLHLRGEEVQTPEGNPAWMLNELQSKYAAGVGEHGTTLDPLMVEHGKVIADRQVEDALKLLENPENVDWFDVNENSPWGEGFLDIVRDVADRGGQPTPEEIAQLRALAEQANGVAGDRSFITHRGKPFVHETFGSDPADQGRAAAWIDAIQAGENPDALSLQTLRRGISDELDKYVDDMRTATTPFKSDKRMPPRAGTKSWRLRGLKMALREAADRGATDLYLPTGQMLPRIEQWLPDFDDMTVVDRREPGIARRVEKPERDLQDQVAASMTSDSDMADEYSWNEVMQNYQTRLPKEVEKYLKKFGAKIEEDRVLPKTGDKSQAATARRIRFTPQLLAEILRGQELYQILGGAGLLGLAASQGEEQPQL